MRAQAEWNVETHIQRDDGAQQAGHPLLHLPGGLVGEGDGQSLVRPHLAALDEVGQTVGEHAGLARAGAGQDQQRTCRVEDGLVLALVEICARREPEGSDVGDAIEPHRIAGCPGCSSSRRFARS